MRNPNFRRPFTRRFSGPRRNEFIRVPELRLIDSDGTMLGVKPLAEALQLAKQRELDLVEIAAQAKPPVCKIMDYSKYQYEQDKKQKESKKKQKTGIMKEIQLKSRIAKHDLETKVKHAHDLLSKKTKVRMTIVFFGRENKHKELGAELLNLIKERLLEVASDENGIQSAGNRMSITFIPK
jgi:translation initiation factor IF-3